jgi:hypothetical protein
MTPQERQLINQLFDRLASLETSPRDPDAEAMIREGLRRAPNAVYSLVQTVLVQDEALKAANAHIQEYEQASGVPNQPEHPRGFHDTMRDSLFGREEPRGSVPRVPQAGAPTGAPPGYRADPWGQGQGQGQGYQGAPMQQQAPMPQQQSGGSSFLGTAAAAAAGMIGGSLLMGGIRSAMGGHTGGGPAAGAFDSLTGRGGAGGGDLSRDAGLDDIGGSRRAGLFDQAQADQDADDDADADEADDVADGGFDDGDSDTA